MSEDDGDALDDLIETAQEAGEQYSGARKTIQEVKDQLRDMVKTHFQEEVISEGGRDDLLDLVDRGEYERVRSQLREARQGVDLKFEDEEKAAFAESFSQSLKELDAAIEKIRTDLEGLSIEGMDQSEAIAYIYGKHSSIRKTDLKKVFSAIDEAQSEGFSRKQKAKLLQAFEPGLNIKPTKRILEVIEEESS